MLLIRASLPATIEIRTDAAAGMPHIYADPTIYSPMHHILSRIPKAHSIDEYG